MVETVMEQWTPARIKALRQRLGASQEGLAQELGVTGHTLYTWERGTGRISQRNAMKLNHLEQKVERGDIAEADAAVESADIEALVKSMARLLATAYRRGQQAKGKGQTR